MAIKLRSFLIRAATTVVFLPLFFIVVEYLNPYWFAGLISIVALLATLELKNLVTHAGSSFYFVPAALLVLAMIGLRIWPVVPFETVLVAGFVLIMLWSLLADGRVDTALGGAAHTVLAALAMGLSLSAMVALKLLDLHADGSPGMGADAVFTLFLVIWMGDSGAYIFGSLLGRHKLAPTISPNKSVEGAVFNVIFNVLGAVIAKSWFFQGLTWTDVLVIGFVVGGVGMLGDLLESLWKRKAAIKDSAGLIPGHGGLLDRLDSFILSAPLLYAYCRYFLLP